MPAEWCGVNAIARAGREERQGLRHVESSGLDHDLVVGAGVIKIDRFRAPHLLICITAEDEAARRCERDVDADERIYGRSANISFVFSFEHFFLIRLRQGSCGPGGRGRSSVL